MIPDHLARLSWYGPHLAWLRRTYPWLYIRHDVPAEVEPTRADLTDADLTDADLTDADLTDADLTRAVLTRAVLTRAVLTRAVLTRAVLTGAVLTGAVLTGAVLTDAVLTDADLTDAVLTDADLTDADLTDAVLTRAVGLVTPEEEAATLDACITAIAREPELWDQGMWHHDGYDPERAPQVGACGTAHCLAGWSQALLPLGHPLRSVSAQACGIALMPRAFAAGWFSAYTRPELQAAVDRKRAELAGGGAQ